MARGQGTLALEEEIAEGDGPVPAPGSADDRGQYRAGGSRRDPEHPRREYRARAGSVPAEVWEALGGYSPTIGVMGAVLGLIHVMMRLDHPEELGEGIATAFVATVYGVGSANLIALPLGARLKPSAKALERERHVVIQGFMLLAEGKPGIVIRQTLQNFLPRSRRPSQRRRRAGARRTAPPQAA